MNIDRACTTSLSDIKSRKATKSSIFRVIILIGINDRYFPTQATAQPADKDIVAQKEDLSSKRSLLYVVITRARLLVYMIGIGKPTGLVELSND